MVDFAKTINAQRNNIREKGNPNAPTDKTKTTITTPTVRYPAERPKTKSGGNTGNYLE